MLKIFGFLATPFGWALNFLYSVTGHYLIALIIITVILRLILLPFSVKQQKNSAKQMRLQAKVNKIRAKYAGQTGREVQMRISEETQELYRREGFSASSMGCGTLLLQMIVMMGLYNAIYQPLTYVLRLPDNVISTLTGLVQNLNGADKNRLELSVLTKFEDIVPSLPAGYEQYVANVRTFKQTFSIFGIDLTQTPSEFKTLGFVLLLIPILAGVTAFLSAGFTYLKQRKTNPEMAKNPTMGCMTFMSPVISVVFAYTLPAGIGFYWIISNILSFIQLVVLSAIYKPETIIAAQMIDETVERRSREASIKATRALLAERDAKDT